MFFKNIRQQIRGQHLFVLLVEYPLMGITLFALWWFFGRAYLIGGVTVFALLLVIAWWGSKPVKSRINIGQGNWRQYMETLLYRGHDRGVMIVAAPDEKRSIQFTKYITEHGVVLQCQFPHSPWSEQYYEPLKHVLTQRGYYYQTWPVRAEDTFGAEIDEFIVVSLEQDLEHAVILTKLILLEIFRLKPTDTAIVWFRYVSPNKNKKIGF